MQQIKKLNNPIMFISDNPTLPGGLSRIGRDLASLAATMPEFRVGYLGRGTGQKASLPFMLYDYPEYGQWGEEFIKDAWNDFSRGEYGVIITLDDISRRHWFANPQGLRDDLQTFLGPGRNFEKWGYFPIDSVGPNYHTLSYQCADSLRGYDRVCASSLWGAQVIDSTCPEMSVEYLPHGYNPDKFHYIAHPPNFLNTVGPHDLLIGCNMANQSRKDWPIAFEVIAHLKKKWGNQVKAWFNTNAVINYRNLLALAADYKLGNSIIITSDLTELELTTAYSACHCTMLPSGGEGFGYPIVESMACGVPCIVSTYSASAELVPQAMRAGISGLRIDTQHNTARAVLSAGAFAELVDAYAQKTMEDREGVTEKVQEMVAHLQWPKLQHVWKKWLREGIQCG